MKDTEVKRLLYQDSEGFKEGVKVGKMEMIEKVEQWLTKSCRGQMIGSLHRFLEEE